MINVIKIKLHGSRDEALMTPQSLGLSLMMKKVATAFFFDILEGLLGIDLVKLFASIFR